MKTKKHFAIFFLISIFWGCQKDISSENTSGTGSTNTLGSFNVNVVTRSQNQSKISWTIPSNSTPTTILYKTYLNSILVAQNLTDTFYTISNILANQSYQGKVVAYTSASDSSTATFTIPTYVSNPIPDSIFVLSNVTDAGGLYLNFTYDTSNKRLSSWSKTYASYNYDSTKIFYTPSGNVLSLVRKSTLSTPYNIIPNIYEYNSQNKVAKIYHKKTYSTDESNTYLTTVSFPLDYDIESYDSLNYNASNLVSSVYKFSRFYNNTTNSYYHSITGYKIISYLQTNDSLPDKITTYTLNSSGGYDQSILNLNTYNNKVNPYYNLFKNFHLIGCDFYPKITTPTFLPYYYFGYALNLDLTSIPYLCTSFGLTYAYNSDGLISQNIKGQDFSEWVIFSYTKVKK